MPAVLLQILALGLSEIVPIEGLIARLHNIFTLNPNVQINIQNLSAEAIQADEDTIQMVADWQAKNGLAVTVKPAPAKPTPPATV
jgi:hypothetical protein